jgi:hypothetical protein
MKRHVHSLILAAFATLLWTGCNFSKNHSRERTAKANDDNDAHHHANLERQSISLSVVSDPVGYPPFEFNGFESPQPLPMIKREGPPKTTILEPGVYETLPYRMIVVVPESCDEQFVVHRSSPDSRMPVINPDLEFIPRKGAE